MGDPIGDTKVQQTQRWVLRWALRHDGVEYPAGSEWSSSDQQLVANLREQGILATPEEALPPEQLADERAKLEAENAALRAQIDALLVEHSVPPSVLPGGNKKGKSAAAEPAAEPAE